MAAGAQRHRAVAPPGAARVPGLRPDRGRRRDGAARGRAGQPADRAQHGRELRHAQAGRALRPGQGRPVDQEPVRDRPVRGRPDRAGRRHGGGAGQGEPDHQPDRVRGEPADQRGDPDQRGPAPAPRRLHQGGRAERGQPHPRALPAQRPLRGQGRAQDHRARPEPRRLGVRDQRGPAHRCGRHQLHRQQEVQRQHAARRGPDARDGVVPATDQRRHLRSRPDELRPGAAAPVLHVAGLRGLPGRVGGGRADARRQGLLHHLHGRGRPAVQVRPGQAREQDQGPGHRPPAAAGPDQGRADLQLQPDRGDGPEDHRGGRQGGLRLRPDRPGPDQARRHQDDRCDLPDQRGAAGLRRAHRHPRQRAHARPGDPARVPAGRGRRLQHRAAAPLAAEPAQPRLLRDGRRQDAARAARPTRSSSTSTSPRSRPASSRSAPASRPRTACWATSACASATCSAAARTSRPTSPWRNGASTPTSASPSPTSSAATSRPASTSSGPRPTCRARARSTSRTRASPCAPATR